MSSAVLIVDIASDGLRSVSRERFIGQIIIWDLQTGEIQERIIPDGSDSPTTVAFSPDAKTIWLIPSPASMNSIIQWRVADLSLDELLTWIAENRYMRDFTCEERAQYRIEPLCEAGW